jgi:predicted transcriptional regulator
MKRPHALLVSSTNRYRDPVNLKTYRYSTSHWTVIFSLCKNASNATKLCAMDPQQI